MPYCQKLINISTVLIKPTITLAMEIIGLLEKHCFPVDQGTSFLHQTKLTIGKFGPEIQEYMQMPELGGRFQPQMWFLLLAKPLQQMGHLFPCLQVHITY